MRAVPPRAISEPEPSSETAVTATVVFPIYLTDVEFPEDATPSAFTTERKQAHLARLALEMLQKHGTPEPIIQECSDEDLVE